MTHRALQYTSGPQRWHTYGASVRPVWFYGVRSFGPWLVAHVPMCDLQRATMTALVLLTQAMHKASAIEEESQMLRVTSTQRVQSASQQLALLNSEYGANRALLRPAPERALWCALV